MEPTPIPCDTDAEHTLCVLAELFTPCRDDILAAVRDDDLWSPHWRAILAGIRAGEPWPLDDPHKLDDLYGWIVQPERCGRVIARVVDLAQRRRLISAAAWLAEQAYQESRPVDGDQCRRVLNRALGRPAGQSSASSGTVERAVIELV